MSLWFLLSLVGVICASIHRVLSKYILNQNKVDSLPFAITFQIIVSGVILAFASLRGLDYSGYTSYWPNILLMGILYALASYFMFMALEHNQASSATILLATSSVWTFISGMIFLGERPGIYPLLGLGLILVAVFLISYEKNKSKLNLKGISYGLIAGMLMGIAFTNDAYVIGDRNAPSYLAFAFLLPALIQLPFVKGFKSSFAPVFKPRVISLTVVYSIIYAIGNISVYSAYQAGGLASVINPMQQFAVISTVILSAIILKERDQIVRKTLSSIIAVIALVLFSL